MHLHLPNLTIVILFHIIFLNISLTSFNLSRILLLVKLHVLASTNTQHQSWSISTGYPLLNLLNSRFYYWPSRPYMNNLLSILKTWLLATSQLDFSIRRLPYAWTGLTIISSPRVPELSLFLLQNFGTICPKTLNLVTLFILLNLSLTPIFLK